MRLNIKTILIMAPFVLLLLISSRPIHAQGSVDIELVREALQRTDEVIGQAREAVMSSRSEKGRVSLEKAKLLQEKAWELYRASRYRMAMSMTLNARKEAWHAMSLARFDTQVEGQLGRIVEDTYDRLIKLRGLVIENTIRDPQALKLLDESRKLLEKSTMNAKQLHFQLSLKLAKSSRNLADRAEKRIRALIRIKGIATRRIATMERLLDRARERIGNNPDQSTMNRIRIAEKELERSREFINEGRYRRAKQSMETCEKILRSLARNIKPAAGKNVEKEIEEAHRLADRAEEVLSQKSNISPGAEEKVATAKETLAKAEEALANGELRRAERFVEAARRMLMNVVRNQKTKVSKGTAEKAVDKTERMRDDAADAIEECKAQGIEALFSRADNHLEKAKTYIAEGKYRMAVAEAGIASNIYERIAEICAL